MELQTYDIRRDKKSKSFMFTSVGPKGNILKLIIYQETSIKNLFLI